MTAGAVLATRNVPTEGRRAAALDGAHHLHLGQAHVAAVDLTPRGTVVAEDVRDLQRRTGHRRGYLGVGDLRRSSGLATVRSRLVATWA